MSRHGAWLVGLSASVSVACGMDMGAHDGMMFSDPPLLASEPSDADFDTTPARDLDPADDVVEVALEAKPARIEISPGHRVALWTYNGQLPGPRIEAKVGDRVRVQLKNSLPEATTIHWHGLRVPSAMDGVEVVQRPIEPGASFTYDFIVPDAGTFWYHPHVRSSVQVERGLYGSIVVHAADEPATSSDHVVMLDDILLNDAWQIASSNVVQAMVGREGNVLLVNGRTRPTLDLQRGGLHRFRFVNAANARYFRIAAPGHALFQIGADGGLLPESQEVDELLLVPGMRADVLVVADADALRWETRPYARGHGIDGGATAPLFTARSSKESVGTPVIPRTLGGAAVLPAATRTRTLKLAENMHMGHGAIGPTFSINGQVFPEITPLTARLGTVEEWSIVNTAAMDHPFHLHGFRFQVVSGDEAAAVWRDTVNVPARETVRIRVPLQDHPGKWMFHCHILEHAEHGMMGELDVAP